MSRRLGILALAAAGLLMAAAVLGLAAKVGRDTSQYLQTVSTQKNWDSPGEMPEKMTTGSGAATLEAQAADGSESARGAAPDVVVSR